MTAPLPPLARSNGDSPLKQRRGGKEEKRAETNHTRAAEEKGNGSQSTFRETLPVRSSPSDLLMETFMAFYCRTRTPESSFLVQNKSHP